MPPAATTDRMPPTGAPGETSVSPRPRGIAQRLLHSSLLEALAYPHGVDRYVELINPLLVKREVRAEIAAVRRQTSRSVTLTLCPNENWHGIRAGQFVNVSVEIDGVRETRPYSPAGSVHAAGGTLELTVSTHPDGKVSRHLRDHARPGTIVGLGQAEGDFVLPATRPERVLLISGGSGITPVMAMLRTLCDEGLVDQGGGTTEVGFLNYARSPELALYGAELAQLQERHAGVRVARGFTRGAQAGSLSGRFDREHLRAAISEHRDAATFVCGPPALIDAVRSVWAQDDLPEPAVETFTPVRVELRHRRRRRHGELRGERPRGRQQRAAAARAGRGRWAGPRSRVPHGHLQHLQLPQDEGHCAQRAHRCGVERR